MTATTVREYGKQVERYLPPALGRALDDRYICRANTPVVDATEAISGALAAMMNGPEPG